MRVLPQQNRLHNGTRWVSLMSHLKVGPKASVNKNSLAVQTCFMVLAIVKWLGTCPACSTAVALSLESCESGETEEEEVKSFRAAPCLSHPLIEVTTKRDQVPALLGCQTEKTAKAGSQLHPMYKQTRGQKGVRGDHKRKIQRLAERSDAPLNPELEHRTKKRQSNKQRGGSLSRDPTPRSRVAVP